PRRAAWVNWIVARVLRTLLEIPDMQCLLSDYRKAGAGASKPVGRPRTFAFRSETNFSGRANGVEGDTGRTGKGIEEPGKTRGFSRKVLDPMASRFYSEARIHPSGDPAPVGGGSTCDAARSFVASGVPVSP